MQCALQLRKRHSIIEVQFGNREFSWMLEVNIYRLHTHTLVTWQWARLKIQFSTVLQTISNLLMEVSKATHVLWVHFCKQKNKPKHKSVRRRTNGLVPAPVFLERKIALCISTNVSKTSPHAVILNSHHSAWPVHHMDNLCQMLKCSDAKQYAYTDNTFSILKYIWIYHQSNCAYTHLFKE